VKATDWQEKAGAARRNSASFFHQQGRWSSLEIERLSSVFCRILTAALIAVSLTGAACAAEDPVTAMLALKAHEAAEQEKSLPTFQQSPDPVAAMLTLKASMDADQAKADQKRKPKAANHVASALASAFAGNGFGDLTPYNALGQTKAQADALAKQVADDSAKWRAEQPERIRQAKIKEEAYIRRTGDDSSICYKGVNELMSERMRGISYKATRAQVRAYQAEKDRRDEVTHMLAGLAS
jgi:hypothetical protein